MNVKDAILSDVMDWIEESTDLEFGQVIPATEGGPDEDGPAPEPPYIMIDLSTFNTPIGSGLEEWFEDDGDGGIQGQKRAHFTATLTLNAFGREAIDHLAQLTFKADASDLSIQPEGPINDLSEIAKRTNIESRSQQDFVITYALMPVPDDSVVEFETLELSTDFGGFQQVHLIP